MIQNIPFEIKYEAENEFSLERFIIDSIQSRERLKLNRLLKAYVKENQSIEKLYSLSTCLKNSMKLLYPNTNVKDIFYCEKEWPNSDMFISKSFSMAYSAYPRQVILSSSFKSVLVSESNSSIITSVGYGCFIFVFESDCTITVKGDDCFVYIAGNNNLVNIVGNNSKVIFSGNDNTFIIRGNSYFKGLSGSDIVFINDEEDKYEVYKIHKPKFIKDLKFETWYKFEYDNGSFIEIPSNQILY